MFRQIQQILEELQQRLNTRILLDPLYKAFREKTTKLKVLGLRLPVMQEIEQTGFSFYKKSQDEILRVWDHVFKTSTIHEVMYLPLFYYRRHRTQLDPTHWRVMKHWIDRVENWEHADALCQLYSILYERYPKLVLPTLKTWNRSKNPWKRRASIVSTIYYASSRRKAPPIKTVLSLIKPLLVDENSYVRKSVGWQLREAYKLWPEETLRFLRKHVLNLSAISFSYATEKLTTNKKKLLKRQRRLDRHRLGSPQKLC